MSKRPEDFMWPMTERVPPPPPPNRIAHFIVGLLIGCAATAILFAVLRLLMFP